MEPVAQQEEPQVFKGDAVSVSNNVESFLKAEVDYYLQYLQGLSKTQAFDVNEYTNWRFVENKANPHRFFLPLSDAVIIDLYIFQNLLTSVEQGFNVDLESYIMYKDSIRESLTLLDPYLIACSFTQTPPSYTGYEQWVLYQQTKGEQIEAFRQQLIPLNTVTYREEVFNNFVMDEGNALTIPEYTKFFERFVRQEEGMEQEYDNQIQKLRESIQGVNLFVFNDYVELCETQSLQPTVDGYHYYFGEVSQTYDADYLKSKHEEVDEAEKSKEQPKGPSKNKNVGNMNEDEEDLADVLEEVEGGHEEYVEVAEGEEAGEMDVVQGDVSELIGLSKQCKCCNGNVYECQGEVCQLLGNCICLSE